MKQLNKTFGIGVFVLLPFLLFLGIYILLGKTKKIPKINLRKIISFEMLFFSLLGYLSIWNGNSIQRASEGLDGGIVGWGIAHLFVSIFSWPIGSLILFFLAIMGLFNSTGLWKLILKFLKKKAADSKIPSSEIEFKEDKQPIDVDEELFPFKDEIPFITEQKDLPPLTILEYTRNVKTDEQYVKLNASIIEKTLAEFGIPASIVGYRVGPTVIQYALEPGYIEKENGENEPNRRKIKVSQISALKNDLALALSAERLRIEAPIPGYSFVGIEIPNKFSNLVRLKQVMASNEFQTLHSPLALSLGLDVSGNPVVADLARMPHLLIAGTTGSGKSVCISALIACLVMNNSPDDLRLAILDPKMVELIRFNGLPHLIGKVETNPERMLAVLAWSVAEMEKRYRALEKMNARDIVSYNETAIRRGLQKMPRIVILIDELADLMLTSPEQTEGRLVRLAQMARATGIHLVLATQRPSTDIVTGLIKANFPARLAFMVASSVDSRVILDMNGAETLMGRGDMLFLDPESGSPLRAQGVMVSDAEIEKINNYWGEFADLGPMEMVAPWESFIVEESSSEEILIRKAISLLKQEGRASASYLQRKLRIGYPRAARLMDDLEEMGIVGPVESGGKERELLIDADDDENIG